MVKSSCIYIIKLPEENYYKYGRTTQLRKRMETHMRNLKFIEVTSVISCINKNISVKVESDLRTYLKKNNMNRVFCNQTEILYSEDINLIVDYVINSIEKHEENKFDYEREIQDRLFWRAININKSIFCGTFGCKKQYEEEIPSEYTIEYETDESTIALNINPDEYLFEDNIIINKSLGDITLC